jgi:hypothetical protein
MDDVRLRLIVGSCQRSTNAQTLGLAGTFLELMELDSGGMYYVHCYNYLPEATVGRTYGFRDN